MNKLTPDEHRILVDAIQDSATVIHKGQGMNEQFKQLALKSGIAYMSEQTAYFKANDGLTVLPSVDGLEKFAELIVRECVAKIRKGTENTVQYDLAYNAMLTAIIADIQESFGVKE